MRTSFCALALLLSCAFSSCSTSSGVSAAASSAPNVPEYGLAEAEPYPEEVNLAYQRLWNFLQRPNGRARASLAQTPYVAVHVGNVSAGDVHRVLRKLKRGTAQAVSFYSSDPYEPANVTAKFVLVFDSRTRRLAAPVGVFTVDSPARGGLGRFGDVLAVYAGTQ